MLRPQARTWRVDDIREQLHIHEGAVGHGGDVRELVRQTQPDWVFHLAAHGAYSFETDYVAMARTNVLGAAELIAATSEMGCHALVMAGSSAEYGYRESAPSEDEPPAPNNHYAATKAAATWLAQISGSATDSCPAVVCRLYSVYGPWEDPRRLMPALISHALDGHWPPLASRPTTRDFVYTDDAVEALVLAARSAGHHRGAVFNVGSGEGTTLEALVGVVRAELGVSEEPPFGEHPGRAWDSRMWWISDPRRIQRELGWTARTGLASGVQQFAAWLREHRHLYAVRERGTAPVPGWPP